MSLKSDRSIWEIREDLDVKGLVVRSYDPLAFGCSLLPPLDVVAVRRVFGFLVVTSFGLAYTFLLCPFRWSC